MILYTEQVFHLQCFFFFFFLILLIHKTVIISNQMSAWCDIYKCCLNKKKCDTNLQSFKHKITFPHGFIFVFIPFIFWTILSNKCCQRWEGGVQNIYKRGNDHRRLSIKGGFKPSVHYAKN